jgi:hypothetical protein
MDTIMWYIIGMILLVLIVIGFYIFDKSKISNEKKYLVYGVLGLPFIILLFYLFLSELLAGTFYMLLLVLVIGGFIACFFGIYSGIMKEKEKNNLNNEGEVENIIQRKKMKKLFIVTGMAVVIIIFIAIAYSSGIFSNPYSQLEGTWNGNIHLASGDFNKITFGKDHSIRLYYSSGLYEWTSGSYDASFGQISISAPYCDESLSFRVEGSSLYLNNCVFIKE